MFSISLFALMVGGVCGVALMCMLTLASRADDIDESQDRGAPLFADPGAKASGPVIAARRMHRAAARGEVACPPWARAVRAQTTVLRIRATRA